MEKSCSLRKHRSLVTIFKFKKKISIFYLFPQVYAPEGETLPI